MAASALALHEDAGSFAKHFCKAQLPLYTSEGASRRHSDQQQCARVTANPVLPHTGPPGTDPLAESIPRNESASIFDPPQDHIR